MKNYEEVTESVFQKSDEIIKRNKRRRSAVMKIGASAGCLAVIGTVGVGAWNRGHNTAPVETVQSAESTVKQSTNVSTVTGNSTGEKSGVVEKVPEVTIGGNMPIMTADSDNSFLFNFPAQIDGFEVEDNEMKVAPDNGQIHISKALNAAMEHYGDVDENGEITYRVVITYLQNRQTIESTRELYNSECARLKEQCGFGLNLETYGFDWGSRYENHICAHLTKSEIERFTANPDYGYAIDLYANYFDLPISNELVIH